MFNKFAATAPQDIGIFEALGIDWFTLLMQILAFLLLVFLMAKFVFPVLVKTIDKRQAEIEESAKAAQDARKQAEMAEDDVSKLLDEAKGQAREIVETAKEEASGIVDAATERAQAKTDAMIVASQDQINQDVAKAKAELKKEAVSLVIAAVQKIVSKDFADQLDKENIKKSIEEVR